MSDDKFVSESVMRARDDILFEAQLIIERVSDGCASDHLATFCEQIGMQRAAAILQSETGSVRLGHLIADWVARADFNRDDLEMPEALRDELTSIMFG